MSHKEPNPHDKKAVQREKNLKNWRIFTQTAEQLKQVDSAAPVYTPPPQESHSDNKAVSTHVQYIRDRTNARRVRAAGIWNNGAGTGGSARMR